MNIIVLPPKTLTASQKTSLQKKGVIIIETDKPESVRVISPETPIESNDYFMAALGALRDPLPTTKTEIFVENLYKRLKANEDAISATANTQQH